LFQILRNAFSASFEAPWELAIVALAQEFHEVRDQDHLVRWEASYLTDEPALTLDLLAHAACVTASPTSP
jgi:hypothetical protein